MTEAVVQLGSGAGALLGQHQVAGGVHRLGQLRVRGQQFRMLVVEGAQHGGEDQDQDEQGAVHQRLPDHGAEVALLLDVQQLGQDSGHQQGNHHPEPHAPVDHQDDQRGEQQR